jgi:hypothetical protein
VSDQFPGAVPRSSDTSEGLGYDFTQPLASCALDAPPLQVVAQCVDQGFHHISPNGYIDAEQAGALHQGAEFPGWETIARVQDPKKDR